ncbi:MAG: potassium/proton antiporter, partial [Muribaculaceae bacterium]|nr:potassium/proton antiporter [Muribaculaceae bacterium]
FIWWLSGMSWTNIHFTLLPSLLLAATMSSTDSASVFGILGSQKVNLLHHLRPMLELESGSNDPMAYMLTIILIGIINTGTDLSVMSVTGDLLMQFGIGGIGGYLFGKLMLWLAGLYTRVGGQQAAAEDSGQASSMISILMLAGVFLAFSVTSDLGGNGYLAVYLCGIVVGNSKIPRSRDAHKYFDSMTWLAQIVVFLMLGLLVNPHEMLAVAPVSLIIGIFMIVVGRPASVFACLLPLRKITFRSKLFVSWVGLRGAVPIIFATYPVVADVEGASHIFNIVFFVTLLSLLLQGTTVISAARVLGLVDDSAEEDEDFGVELADNIPTVLETIKLNEADLASGNTLKSLALPQGRRVVLIKRGDRYIVPDGQRTLFPGDSLLLISEER